MLLHAVRREPLIRLIALVLFLGGGFWGVLLAPVTYRTDKPFLAALIFGPGYLVTLAYGYRLFCRPTIRIRQSLWSFSILVQGAWLYSILGASLWENPPIRTFFQATIPSLWWTGATLSSLLALFLETKDNSWRHFINEPAKQPPTDPK